PAIDRRLGTSKDGGEHEASAGEFAKRKGTELGFHGRYLFESKGRTKSSTRGGRKEPAHPRSRSAERTSLAGPAGDDESRCPVTVRSFTRQRRVRTLTRRVP